MDLAFITAVSDSFIKLLQYKNKRTHIFYNTIVTPCLEHAKIARDDIMSICDEIEQAVKAGQPPISINDRFVAAGRTARGSRDFLRGSIETSSENFTDFEHGIEMLIKGCGGHAIMVLHHNVYQLALLIQRNSDEPEKVKDYTSRQFQAIAQTRKNTEEAWRMIVSGYKSYADECLARPA